MNYAWLFPPTLAALLTGCGIGLKPEGVPPRPESVTGILFRAETDQLSSRGKSVDTKALAQTVTRNLDTWGFPVSADPDVAYSHVMEPRVGEIVHDGDTPTGFSFSVGNSDPRSLEFQKADVVTITCTLRGAKAHSHENAYLKETFMADEVMKGGGKSLFDAYSNHIATACFNLLSQLKIQRSKPDPVESTSTSSSTWFPDVRIEVKDKPVAVKAPPKAQVVLPAPPPSAKTSATQPAAAMSSPAQAPESAATPEAASEETTTPAIQTEVKEDETRKQMIIHNQGHPIILEFGYDRK
ncbi:hypothetical protein [Methyloterricola oryzae]|uniref:hypothetical protein n=1 Tax=Methyloterricola oryzae TaxID=1495050 RepID=UPI0005EBA569|nr:hypothetical protein [Methyloterricola oryzae]